MTNGEQLTGGKATSFILAAVIALFLIMVLQGCAPSIQTGSWESLNGPQSQNITSLTVDQKNPGILYAGLTSGQVFMTTNRGETWTRHSIVKQGAMIHELVQHPDDPAVMFAATGEGLFHSTDSARTWKSVTLLHSATAQPSCRTLSIDQWNPLQIYAGCDGHGILKSTDGGVNWTACVGNLSQRDIANSRVFQILVHPARPDILTATLSSLGVIRSTDGGASWITVTDRFIKGGTSIARAALDVSLTESILLSTSSGDIYKTTDGGSSWTLTRQGQGYVSVQSFIRDPVLANVLYAGTGSGLLVSTDFGSTWTTPGTNQPAIPMSLVVSSDSGGSVLYSYGQGIGVARSTDGGSSWKQMDQGIGNSSVSQMITSKDGGLVYASVGHAVYRFAANRGWESISAGLPGSMITTISKDGDVDSMLYAATTSGLFWSRNTGREWQQLGTTVRGTSVSFFSAHPSITNRLFAVTAGGLMMSTDRGTSWKPTRPVVKDYLLNSITFHPSNAGIISCGTSNKGVIATTDGGLTWDQRRYGMSSENILAVSFHPEEQQIQYAWAADGGAFRSTNGGLEWSPLPTPWTSGRAIRIAIDFAKPSSLIALVDDLTLFRSENGGEAWMEFSSTPLTSEILTLCWDGTSGILLAGTKDDGVFRLSMEQKAKKTKKKR